MNISLFQQVLKPAVSRVSRPVYPVHMKQQQRGLILVLTLIVLSILFLMLSYGWQQFFSNAKTVTATKQNIQSYQEMRGHLMEAAYKVKDESVKLTDAILGRGVEEEVPIDDPDTDITVALRRANKGDVEPTIYGYLCEDHSIGSGDNNSGGFKCQHMLLTVRYPLSTIAGQTELKQTIGFGISTKK